MALTEDLTFKLGDLGIVLNTDSSGPPFVDVINVVGLDSAPYRETRHEREGDDGGFIDAEFERGRDIILTGDVVADSDEMEEYLDSLKADFAPSTTLIPFYYKAPGVDERLIYVKPLGCKYDWDTMRRTGQARIQFKAFAEDPRLYASTETTINIPFAVGSSLGFGFNLGFDFGFGGSSGTDGVFVTNSGNRPTPVRFTINGPAETPTIRDDTYGHSMTFDISIAAGETLVVDTQYKTVMLNGTTNRRGTLVVPDWFYLQPGQTFIRYNALTGTGSSMDVAFRSAWR
jgi:hypothetical protein